MAVFDKICSTTTTILKSLANMDKTIETIEPTKKSSDLDGTERNINEFVIKKDLLREKLETIMT